MSEIKCVRKAVIDIGTSSIKLFVFACTPPLGMQVVLNESAIARLGEGLSDGRLKYKVMERNCEAICKFTRIAKENDVIDLLLVGTRVLRCAANADTFMTMVKARCGLEIRVLTADEEATLAFMGAVLDLKIEGPLLAFDTGGGSTEFIYGNNRGIIKKWSVNIGAVSITEAFFDTTPSTPQRVQMALKHIESCLEEGPRRLKSLVGIGGSVTTMAAVKHCMHKYDGDKIHGSLLQLNDVERQLEMYRKSRLDDRKKITGLHPDRAGIILAGACIVLSVMANFGVKSLLVSDRGLRHGLAAQMCGHIFG